MDDPQFQFIDQTGAAPTPLRLIEPVVIKKAQIDAEVARLAALPAPGNGRRVSIVTHPETGVGRGLTFGTGVSIQVLRPGERTAPKRQNASLVEFCIAGSGQSVVDGRPINFRQYDVWTIPAWNTYQHANATDDLQVRLTYSNEPMLEKLGVYVAEENPHAGAPEPGTAGKAEQSADPALLPTFQLSDTGAFLMPYETLINPPHVEATALHWPWVAVKAELDKLRALGDRYRGRRLYLLYDPTTGRTNGTTFSFFATMTVRPANIVDRPHRHISSAINYYFSGSGYSVVERKRYEWAAGDLMLSAPGWAVHNHASNGEDVYELTVQDQPMHLALGSLLWQEDLQVAPRLLGATRGFGTNRSLR
jgi:gentisate 1,2-dioxygenase